VIIPVYNGERYVAEAIESVLAQTHPPFEIIVVDDGSTDGTSAVVRRFGPPVRHSWQEHQEAGGAARGRNLGVELARGELVAFIDADDLWVPEKLDWQVAGLQSPSRPDLVFGLAKQFISPELGEQEQQQIDCTDAAMPAHLASALLLSRETFRRVGPFEAKWRLGEFLDWYLRANELGLTSLQLPEVILLRRLHRTNMGVRLRDARADYARILKASLDRRRGRTVPGTTTPVSHQQ
jgi:glycosyltransferase involved in cell wall biosynthesis